MQAQSKKVQSNIIIIIITWGLLYKGWQYSHKIISQYFKEICNNDDMSEYKKIKLVGGCSLQMAVFISAKKMKGISILPTYCDWWHTTKQKALRGQD